MKSILAEGKDYLLKIIEMKALKNEFGIVNNFQFKFRYSEGDNPTLCLNNLVKCCG